MKINGKMYLETKVRETHTKLLNLLKSIKVI